jgi:regulator of sirC expression with transglutaminase-like and TPR domain
MSDDARQAFLMAESYVQNKQFIDAIGYYERGLRLYPTDPKDQWNAAMIWEQLNCPEDAIYNARAYLELQPDAPDAPAVRDQLLIWEAKAGVPHVAESAPAAASAGPIANALL